VTVARATAGETITLGSAQTALALVTRLAVALDAPRGDVLGDSDPAAVLAAMECIAAGVLAGLQPGDRGAGVLERIGLGLASVQMTGE